jgi:NDP-sugar pyrophosphorylase family protein
MTELIGNNSVPKCLIPFGGNPLLFYPLKSLAMNGFAGKGNYYYEVIKQ